MRFEFEGREYQTRIWQPEDGIIGHIVAVDTETTLIEAGKIPDFVIGQAFAGGDTVYLIHLEHLLLFFETHKNQILVMHNAAFDTAVVTKEVGFDFESMIRTQRLWDISILYRLLQLANIGEVPHRYSLALMSETLLAITVDKSMEIRGAFGKYRDGTKINYTAMTKSEIKYAAIDSIVTFYLYENTFPQVKEISPGKFLTHKIQLMGDVALAQVSRNGFGIDLSRRADFLSEQDQRIKKAKDQLVKFGYIHGKPGVQKKLFEILNSFGIDLPRTAKSGKPSIKEEYLEPYRLQYPFIDAYLSFKTEEKLKSFIVKLDKPRIHAKFNGIMTTGRTSSESPNLQQIPKDNRVRNLFVPQQSHLFAIADYKQLELCTLAQVCLDRFRKSKMADLINAGIDLHRWFASKITSKSESEVTSEERGWAKACNFGFPGGLGIRAFISYALKSYGVNLSESQALDLKGKWLDAFPEMRLYLEDNLLSRHDFNSLGWCSAEIAAAIFKRIARGEINSVRGQPYSPETKEWALKTVLEDLAPEFAGIPHGSPEVLRAALQESVITRTGRIRANTDYCAARNTPFQGLASDGAKIALYELIFAGFKVVNFVHDEAIIEISKKVNLELAKQKIIEIMKRGMKKVVPDVDIQVSAEVSDYWKKL